MVKCLTGCRAIGAWLACVLALSGALPGTAARAADRPLWELALGGGVLSLPYYRGAEDNRVLPVPFVYPVYRGEVLRIDDDGVRGLFFESDRVKLDVSADGSIPGSDDDVTGREGMPNLEPTVQIGPSLRIDLWQRRAHAQNLRLILPLRGVVALSTSPDYVGFAVSPKLSYGRDARFAGRPWRLAATGGLEFGSQRLHDHFYSVDPQFQTAQRPAFEASDGYAGTRFTLSAQSRHGNNWIGAFVRYDQVGGAVFDDSPLVRRSANLSAGIVVGWFVARSRQTVTVADDEVLPD